MQFIKGISLVEVLVALFILSASALTSMLIGLDSMKIGRGALTEVVSVGQDLDFFEIHHYV